MLTAEVAELVRFANISNGGRSPVFAGDEGRLFEVSRHQIRSVVPSNVLYAIDASDDLVWVLRSSNDLAAINRVDGSVERVEPDITGSPLMGSMGEARPLYQFWSAPDQRLSYRSDRADRVIETGKALVDGSAKDGVFVAGHVMTDGLIHQGWCGEFRANLTPRWEYFVEPGHLWSRWLSYNGGGYIVPRPCGDVCVVNLGALQRTASRIAGIDRSNGSVRWHYDLTHEMTSLHATPERTCLGSYGVGVVLDSQTGKELHRISVPGAGPSLLSPWGNGFLFVGQTDQTIRVFDATCSKQLDELLLPSLYAPGPEYGFALGDGILCMTGLRTSGEDHATTRGVIVIRDHAGDGPRSKIAARPTAEIRREGTAKDPVYVVRIVGSDLYEVRKAFKIDLRLLGYRIGVGREPGPEVDRKHKGKVIVETDLKQLPPEAETSLQELLAELSDGKSRMSPLTAGAGKKYKFQFELRPL